MNGAQDLGGMMGFGPVAGEPEGAYFHAEWEKRVLALTLALGSLGEWNIDMSRQARESLHPADYLNSSYYEVWFKGLEKLLVARGLVNPEEIAASSALHPPKPTRPPLMAAQVEPMLAAGTPSDRAPEAKARFSVGEEVRTLNLNPSGHTRLPRYARGKRGRIERVHGVFVFPDANADGRGPSPQWLYLVRFSASELWGREGDPALDVSIDAWESYLEGADVERT
jgi:nitrile hydratase subunit beta